MGKKKFKTIAGYLRSMEQDLWHRQSMAELNGRAGMSTDDGQRQIINNLLPQIGITGNIDAAEKPVDAIKRLRQMPENAAHSKALDTCLRWLNKPELVSTQITGVHVVSTG